MKQILLFTLLVLAVLSGFAVLTRFPGGVSRTLHSESREPEEEPKLVTVRFLDEKGQPGPAVQVPSVVRSDEEWRLRLTPEQYKVARSRGTEPAFCGAFHDNHKTGLYSCAGCGLPLFRSDSKFDSGTGWPSFFQPVAKENVTGLADYSHGMVREEVRCTRCGSHLGHVFSDGPAPTRLRFCINSVALDFREEGAPASETIFFAAGCFWGVEEALMDVPGVKSTEVGYAGGHTDSPTYQDVCYKQTGHAETVKVVFDPQRLPLHRLLETFWKIHDPTSVNRQGLDFGSQYRSAVFFSTPDQEGVIRSSIERLNASHAFSRLVVTQVDLAGPFFRAEEYHQKYAQKHGGGACRLPGI